MDARFRQRERELARRERAGDFLLIMLGITACLFVLTVIWLIIMSA